MLKETLVNSINQLNSKRYPSDADAKELNKLNNALTDLVSNSNVLKDKFQRSYKIGQELAKLTKESSSPLNLYVF